MRHGRLGLQQALRGDLPDLAVGNVREVALRARTPVTPGALSTPWSSVASLCVRNWTVGVWTYGLNCTLIWRWASTCGSHLRCSAVHLKSSSALPCMQAVCQPTAAQQAYLEWVTMLQPTQHPAVTSKRRTSAAGPAACGLPTSAPAEACSGAPLPPPDSTSFCTSAATMRPPGPLPCAWLRSTPASAASLRA